jgi:hypothetical protein
MVCDGKVAAGSVIRVDGTESGLKLRVTHLRRELRPAC